MKLRRFDTLFTRLFVLMWVTLVASHLVAMTAVMHFGARGPLGEMGPGAAGGPGPGRLPLLSSLPPGNPFDSAAAPAGGPPRGPAGPRPGLPASVLGLDYGLRALVIALGAALGARWLSAPMRRLSQAAQSLSAELARGKAPAPLDEGRGTYEVQAVAGVFNAMARRLHEQFDARGMQMAALSHDLRTPLTRLRIRLQDAPPALADAASGDVHEMSEMIDATLAVLREQRDGAPAAPMDLRSLLQAIVDDHVAVGQDVALAPGASVRARARPAALRRVVDNLVGNALRYGGSARLALQLDGERVLITVDDTGPGIPEEQLEQAFEPWTRLDPYADPRAGHGLGLSIARDLAERDGGRLTLANRAEGGLRATLALPAIVSAPTSKG